MINHNLKVNLRSRADSILVFCILLLSFSLLFGMAFAQNSGQIDVHITGYNSSSAITASLLDSNLHFLQNKTVNTPSFSFTGVPPNQPYFIVLYYEGVPYYTQLNATQSLQQLVTIPVYEVTSADENIAIAFHHVAISKGTNNDLNVTEYIQFVNIGNKVQTGIDLKIAMPEGYKNLGSSYIQFLQQADFGYFFKVPNPLFPNGSQTVDLQYQISPSADQYQLAKREYYDTGFAVVTVLSGSDLKVVPNSNQSLASEGPITIQAQTYDAYSATNIYAGEGFAITLTGYKPTTAGVNIVWVGTGVLLAVIAGTVVYSFRRNKVSSEQLESESEALSTVMSELEKDFKDGKIEEVEYLKLKLKYKSRLEKVQDRLQQFDTAKVNAKPKPKLKAKESKEEEKDEEG